MKEPLSLTKKERRVLRKQEKREAKKKGKRKQLLKRIIFWSLAFLGIVAIIFAVTKGGSNPSNQPALSVATPSASDWTKGSSNAKVTLIEYSDFQCPACGNYHPIVKQITQEFADELQLVYRHFPLTQAHRNAEMAAFAAEAAGRQDKFWLMHDMIFENQDTWSDKRSAKETFIEYAELLSLDIERFKEDIESREIKNKVRNDYQSGVSAGVNSTPTFFLNGNKLPSPRSYEDFKNTIQQTINKN